MKEHYDFSKKVRGKFYNPNAVFQLPVYLDEPVQGYLSASTLQHFESLAAQYKRAKVVAICDYLTPPALAAE